MDSDIVGKSVSHTAFGAGTVAALAGNVMTVSFKSGEKKFVYPDAFGDFLTLADAQAQQAVDKQLADNKAKLNRQNKKRQAELKRRQKLMSFKIVPNSHAAFNITPQQAKSVFADWTVSTGTYLSGYSKGSPKIADKLKPNSVCLLTECPEGHPEADRLITGAFMVQEDFFGEDVTNGKITAHPLYRLRVPQELRLHFWDNVGQSVPARWGSLAFKYCSSEVVSKILRKLAEASFDSENRQEASDFYSYYCAVNRLPAPLMRAKSLPTAKPKAYTT